MTAQSHAKKRAVKQTAAEKKEAAMAANRKAQLQWYAVGLGIALTLVVVLVLISVYTEGELPYYNQGGN